MDIPFRSVNKGDILKLALKENHTISSIQGPANTPTAKYSWEQITFRSENIHFNDYIPIERVELLIKSAEIINNNPNLKRILHLFLKASHFMADGEFNIAFLMSFLIIERYYYQQLDIFLDNSLKEAKHASKIKKNF